LNKTFKTALIIVGMQEGHMCRLQRFTMAVCA